MLRRVMGWRYWFEALQALLAAAFVAFRLDYVLTGTAISWQDTASYEATAGMPFFSRGFLAGQRPPLSPLLWKLTGSLRSYDVAQTDISIAAFIVLAVVVGRLASRGAPRLVAFAAVLTIGSSLPVVMWDLSMLSETLALSFGGLSIASLLLVAERATPIRMTALALSAAGFALARDSDIATVGILGAGVLVVAVARRGRAPLFKAVVLGSCLLSLAAITEGAALSSGRNQINVVNNYDARVFPDPGRVAWFAGHGMPDAAYIDQLATHPSHEDHAAPYIYLDESDPHVKDLVAWLDRTGARTYLLWLAENPVFVVSAPFEIPPEAFNFAGGDLTFYQAPGGPVVPWLFAIVWNWWTALGLLGAACAAALWRRPWSNRVWRATLGLVAIGFASVIVSFQGDSQEITRHSIEARIWLLLALVAAVAAAFGGRSGEKSGQSGDRFARTVAN
ncbi:MAG TPA: hypothetical protein VGS21_12405 [Acidimicrobiales bacterium]|nr:hypothetical protein [Acidimicrobiales bacterium]